MAPIIVWFRRDLRLEDHDALTQACQMGGPVIPIFIHDDLIDDLGAAPKWRLEQGIAALAAQLAEKGSQLILRRGDALGILQDLIATTGAQTVFWSRAYDPASQARDRRIKADLAEDGVNAQSFRGHLLFEPWHVATKAGGFFKVFTPMWNTVRDRHVDGILPAPASIPAPEAWPVSDVLEDWKMGRAMNRGAGIMAQHALVGAPAALDRLGYFTETLIDAYKANRDFPAMDATSGLAQNLALGEISPRRCWHAALHQMHQGDQGAEQFLKELVWREFAYHLLHHTPKILDQNWKPDWDKFPWSTDERDPRFVAWTQGRTGIEFVDAAMRQMYVTGTMHNRARMIVASYLTKHLMTHWRLGQKWFADCLIDWDPASNAMGWQWAAGSGPDAAPYFRIFNPVTQLAKFDANADYRNAWIAEGQSNPPKTALDYFDAIPRSWALDAQAPYPDAIVSIAKGREIALAAYQNRGF